jgi:tRNA A37 threonylcarbamoyladenosine synthetase subunit TsaC/SUA5/YrdC
MTGHNEFDPVADGKLAFEAARDGGVAIFKADVGYAIIGHTEEAIARIYEAKARSFSKPCGCFANWDLFNQAIVADERARDFVSAVIHGEGLPLSIVGTFRPDHPVIANAAPYVRRNATKSGTIDLLLNAGPTHDEIARLALATGVGIFGSSANRSLTGSKFVFEAIEPEVREAADLALDRGACRYSNEHGLGSTIIDLASFEPIRIGICFDEIQAVADKAFGIHISSRIKRAL